MKRVICYLLCLLLFMAQLPANAQAIQEENDIIYLEDGSYFILTLTCMENRAGTNINGAKSYTYYGSNGAEKWKATLSGSFTYDGSSATCTSSSCSVTIYNNSWYTISKSASKSGNSAFGSATMGYKVLGITTNQVTRDISLTCDKDGNLS